MSNLLAKVGSGLRSLPGLASGWVVFLWKGLWGAHVPLVWHIVVVLIAAIGTYNLAPKITEQMERQKIRSGYISKNLDEMNVLVGDFYVAVMQAVAATDSAVAKEKFSKVDEIGARISWKAIQIGAVLPSDKDKELLKSFQTALHEVQLSAVKARQTRSTKEFQADLRDFASISVMVIQGVAQRAELSISTAPSP